MILVHWSEAELEEAGSYILQVHAMPFLQGSLDDLQCDRRINGRERNQSSAYDYLCSRRWS
jgi:hypothetical protein